MAVSVATVEAAITAIQDSGQSFTIDGFTYTKGNIQALIDLRDRLQNEAERSSGDRPLMRAFKFTNAGYG